MQTRENDREFITMKATQLPLLVNNATTGHKLQGSSVDNIFVHNWSYVTNWVYVVINWVYVVANWVYVVTNWVYVMLSRVKTRVGLFCRNKLSKDLKKYAVPEGLRRILDRFRSRCAPTYWTEEQYDELFETE